LVFSFIFLSQVIAQQTRVKPRIIATTDGEIDDQSSMIRFLMYCSDYDVAGIVQVNSKYQKNGHSSEHWIEKEIDAYESVLPNLRIHNPDYPDADSLRSVLTVGNENINDLYVAPPDMATKNTPGEQLIIKTLLDDDPRPVHVVSWGGANTTASALWRLKYSGKYTKEQFDYAVSKIRIYCIIYQDGGGQWIEDNVKEAYINEAHRWSGVWNYHSIGSGTANPPEQQAYMGKAWLAENVKSGHGSLGAMYPQDYTSEGDTPSFLHLINNGLESQKDYTLGGWGGRSVFDDPVNKPNYLTDAHITDDGNTHKMYWRWVIAAQNDWAARMDWCVADAYSKANHQPVARIVGSNIRSVLPGNTIILDATPTTDPDRDSLSFSWWEYDDADNAVGKVSITNATSIKNASFVVPDEPGKQIHMILEVKDNGNPPLISYQRIIFNVSTDTIHVTGVEVSPSSIQVGIDRTEQLTASVIPTYATVKNVAWSSSDTSVARVNTSGIVTGVKNGTAEVTATTENGGFTARASVEVTHVPVVGINVSPDKTYASIGGTSRLYATVIPFGASNQTVSWKSINPSVASVDTDGLVKGVSEGTAAIIGKTDDGGFMDTSIVQISFLPVPLVRLDFDGNGGSNVVNTGSVPATFTKTNPPSWSSNIPVSGGVGSVDFGIVTGNYYVESDSVISQLGGLNSFTVTGWVNCRSSDMGSGGNRIVSWINNSHDGVDIVYKSDGALQVGINQWPDNSVALSSSGEIPTNSNAVASNWKFFAVTYESSKGELKFYFGDNTTAASLDKTIAYDMGVVGNSIGKLAIGHFNEESERTSRTDRVFRGLIDQIQVFDSAFSLGDIQAIQYAGNGNTVSVTNITNFPEANVRCHPNPFSNELHFEVSLSEPQKVHIELYNINGEKIAVMGSRKLNAGKNSFVWDCSTPDCCLRPGIYILSITLSKSAFRKEIKLLKE
jgi:uncharacterized protein YjdB